MEADCTAEWTKDNIQTLLNAMKSSIPSREREKTWNAGLKSFNWNKVAFGPFSAEECCAKWQEIMQKLRKIKTLTELIVDAHDAIENQASKPDLRVPKKPVSANALFVSKNIDKLKKKHPEIASQELMKYANKAYKNLSAKDKEKYQKKAQKRKEEYKAKMIGSGDDSEDGTETLSVPPPKPPMTAYNLFCHEQKSQMTGIPYKEITKVWAQRWNKLSPKEKGEYSCRCYEMREEYNVKLNKFLSAYDKEKQEWIMAKYRLKRLTFKRAPAKTKSFPGEPQTPIRTAPELFYSKQINKTRLTQNQNFKDLSPQKQQRYQEKVNENMQTYAVKLQRWFETLTATEQQEYCDLNRNKLQFLRTKKGLRTSYHRTSDSEDEDSEDSSSSSSSSSSDTDDILVIEPNENDDEENEVMFDIF